jgi:hypothetical protein
MSSELFLVPALNLKDPSFLWAGAAKKNSGWRFRIKFSQTFLVAKRQPKGLAAGIGLFYD